MNTLISYLLIACLGSVLFVGLDLLVLKPFASHKQRRQVLLFAILMISLSPLAGIFLPLELPQIRFVYQEQKAEVGEAQGEAQWLPTLVIGAKQEGEKALSLNKNQVLILILSILWALLSSLYLYRMIKRLKALHTLHRKSKRIAYYQEREVRELLDEEQNAFSFLGTIYLSKSVWESPQKDYILKHEMAHIQLGHSYDMLLSEFLLLPQCFNPFADYLKQALKEVHEYQADELVLSDESVPRKAYQYTLLCFAMQGDYDPVCQFFRIPYLYNNQLKKRIIMMKNERKASSKWSYVLALPITALMLWGANSCSTKKATKEVGLKPAVERKAEQKVAEAPKKVEAKAPTKAPKPKKNKPMATISKEKFNGEAVWFIPDEPCEFPGGIKALMNYLSKNINYPDLAQKNGIQGRVIISFIVAKDGSIQAVKVVRGIDPLLDKEAVRVIKAMPKWKAGKLKGKAINQRFTLPIVFRLTSFKCPAKKQ